MFIFSSILFVKLITVQRDDKCFSSSNSTKIVVEISIDVNESNDSKFEHVKYRVDNLTKFTIQMRPHAPIHFYRDHVHFEWHVIIGWIDEKRIKNTTAT